MTVRCRPIEIGVDSSFYFSFGRIGGSGGGGLLGGGFQVFVKSGLGSGVDGGR